MAATGSGYPFTEHLQVWKVAGKVFLIVTEDDPELEIITVKAEPHHGDALRREHDSIIRGHYLDKDHWISIGSGAGITPTVVDELVQDSYDLVREQLPLKDRP
nr:MmcQ/YjbR family DNA-binding protein [Brevibacterium marinum]